MKTKTFLFALEKTAVFIRSFNRYDSRAVVAVILFISLPNNNIFECPCFISSNHSIFLLLATLGYSEISHF